jgi:hypothetical protein
MVAATSAILGLGMALGSMEVVKYFSSRVWTVEVLFEFGRRTWRVLARLGARSLIMLNLSPTATALVSLVPRISFEDWLFIFGESRNPRFSHPISRKV